MPNALKVLWQILGILILCVFYNTLDAPFVYDDKIEVIGNTTIRFLDEWQSVFAYNQSRAILQLTYAINYAQGGLEPRPYHITNLFIHFLSIGAALWMVFSFSELTRHKKATETAVIVASLWAIHPMITESVIYITGRSESLCALFCFLSLAAWSTAIHTQRHRYRFIAAFFCLCALLCKEVAFVIPIAFAYMEWTFSPPEQSKKWRVVWQTPIILLVVFAIGLRSWGIVQALQEAQSELSGINVLQNFIPQEVERPLTVRLTTQAEVWLHYFGLWVLPIKQTLYHHIPDSKLASLPGILGLLGWGVTMVSAWRFSRNSPLARLALILGFLVLLPSSSIASLKENMAEHRSHQMGLFLILYLIAKWPTAWRIKQKQILFALIPLTLLTLLRTQVWQSEVGLWEEATKHNPEIGEAWYGLGDAYRFADNFEASTTAFQKCAQLDPEYLDCWNNLGIVFAETGQFDLAESAWKTLLRKEPTNCRGHNNLGSLAFQLQDWEASKGEFISTLQYCPNNLIAHYTLANIYYGPLNDPKQSTFHYQMVLEIDPTFVYAAEARRRLLDLTW